LFRRKRGGLKKLYSTEVAEDEIALLYLGYSAIAVKTSGLVLLFDPANLVSPSEAEKLDLILFTHGHYDHFDASRAIELHRATGAPIVVEPSLYGSLKGALPENKLFKAVGTLSVDGITVDCIEGRHVGPITLYLVELENVKIFHGGDSAYVPLYPRQADLAIVPTGSPSPTASPDDAYRMVVDLRAKAVVPVHGSEGQHRELERRLRENYPGARVYFAKAGEPVVVKLST